LDVRFIAIYLF